MATKAKETSVAGKEKKAQSSNSPMTSTKKIPTKASTTSSTNKATSSPSEKQVPNYLKPTISSLLDSHSSFKLPRNDAPTKPTLNRRRSLDPSSSSRLQKHAHTPSLTLPINSCEDSFSPNNAVVLNSGDEEFVNLDGCYYSQS